MKSVLKPVARVGRVVVRSGFFYLLMCALSFVNAQESDRAVESVGEVSIIGNTELPNVTFNLPWRLPSVEKREEQSPPREIPGMLTPIEPKRHRQQVHFSRYLEVEMPQFNTN